MQEVNKNIKMSAAEAIEYVVYINNIKSIYEICKKLSNSEIKVQPIQISNYRTGSKMSPKVAARFKEVYGITIDDIYNPGIFVR